MSNIFYVLDHHEGNVKFLLSNSQTSGLDITNMDENELKQLFPDSSKKIYFLCHGWLNEADSSMCVNIRDAHLRKEPDCHVSITIVSILIAKLYTCLLFNIPGHSSRLELFC